MTIDEWTVDGKRITDGEILLKLRKIIEEESALIVEHRFYKGARSPYRFVCDDFEHLEAYFQENARAGDSLYFWRFEDCCQQGSVVESAKVPDRQGRTPKGGAY